MADTDKTANSYSNILKGTSMLGGVQVLQILLSLVRGKFAALFLGPAGLGIVSLLNSSCDTISRVSSLGLNLAFVREISAAEGQTDRKALVLAVSKRLIWLTAILGAIFTFICAPWLSRLSFGSEDLVWQFRALGLFVGMTVATWGYTAILQGLHEVKILSARSLAGAIFGLVISVPIYAVWHERGIVPAMLAFGGSMLAFCLWGVKRTTREFKTRQKVSIKENLPLVKHLLSIGVIMLAALVINSACMYAINVFVRSGGNLEDVGLFNAANSMTMQYASVVITAIALDYFPRLTAAGSDRSGMALVINRQMEIVSLIATPMCLALLTLAPVAIKLLLTAQFEGSLELIRLMSVSVLFKALAYPLGYVSLAQNDRKLFFWLEAVACNVLYLGCSLGGYALWGLTGLGYGAVAEQALCLLLYMATCKRRYGYRFNSSAALFTLLAAALSVGAFLLSHFESSVLRWSALSLLTVASTVFGFVVLRNKVKKRG